MGDQSIFVKEALRIFFYSLRTRIRGIKRYKGDTEQICKQIIKDCYNQKKQYFQTSAGHFCEFYTRDFGWCTRPLINLGYKRQVSNTLNYALKTFQKHDRITTSISPNSIPFDFPYFAVDSLPYLIRSLKQLNDKELIKKYKDFLNKKIFEFEHRVVDKNTNMVKKDRYFSSMKDHSKRNSSCYDNCMLAMLSNELKKTRLENPFKDTNFKTIIKEKFWNNRYFYDDLNKYPIVTGDSNIFPFYTEVFKEKPMLRSVISQLQKHGLDKPLPLKYTEKHHKQQKMISAAFFSPGYERDTSWAHMGPIFISLVKKINKSSFNNYLDQYKNTISSNKNYLELFSPDKRPYKSFFYYSDTSMLWSSMILDLIDPKPRHH